MNDAITRLPFVPVALRKCPHQAVQKRYGAGCMVSVYTCKRCQYGEKHEMADAWKCTFENKAGG